MRLLIVEPELHGHKAFYLSLIIKAFKDHKLTLLTQPDHPALSAHCQRQEIDLNTIELIPVSSRKPTDVFAQCATLNAVQNFDRIFITYLDHYLPLMASTNSPLGSPVHGIWFHPHALDRKYNWLPPVDKRIRQRRTLHRWLKTTADKSLEHVYFLDPDAVKQLNGIAPNLSASYLPDPGERAPKLSRQEARKKFNLPQDRRIFLHGGSPEKRKGLPDLIEAFYRLAQDPEWRAKSLLLRIGPNERLSPKSVQKLNELIEQGCAQTSGEFVSEEDFIEYFAAADCIMLPYRNFRYSSGILANAIMAQRPVICSDYGLIAKTVKQNQIGSCYKHGSNRSLKQALTRFSPDWRTISPITADQFIEQLRKASCP